MQKIPFLKAAAVSAAIALGLPSCGPAAASGLPVVDAAAMAQDMSLAIQDYMQQLKDYATYLQQLETQINGYKRKIQDATKPYRELYSQVSKTS